MSYKFAFQLARKTKESNDEQYPKQNTILNELLCSPHRL